MNTAAVSLGEMQPCFGSLPQRKFWLLELRTPSLLIELAHNHPNLCRQLTAKRPLLTHAASGKTVELEQALIAEETVERESDRIYWLPLRQELEKLRHAR